MVAVAPRRKTENAVHVPLYVWIREHVSPTVWHVPNGMFASRREGGKMKVLGVRAGVPDLAFIALHGPHPGMTYYLEVKAPDGALSAEQKMFAREAQAAGAPWACVYSKDEGIAQCRAWGVVRPRLAMPWDLEVAS